MQGKAVSHNKLDPPCSSFLIQIKQAQQEGAELWGWARGAGLGFCWANLTFQGDTDTYLFLISSGRLIVNLALSLSTSALLTAQLQACPLHTP